MKKLSLLMFICILVGTTSGVNAQTERQEVPVSNVPDCFCCSDSIYKLPARLTITGPSSFNCGTAASFAVTKCPGASYSWTVSPAIKGITGNGTNVITLPAAVPAGNYTITLVLRCGNKTMTSQFTFVVIGMRNCTPAFIVTVTLLRTGFLNINTVPEMLTPGQEHWWGMQLNGTYPNCVVPCTPIPFSNFNPTGVWGGYINTGGVLFPYKGDNITTGTTSYGINYSGFPNNSCIKITHYVKCCGVLIRQTQCISVGTINSRSTGDIKPNITIGEIETVAAQN